MFIMLLTYIKVVFDYFSLCFCYPAQIWKGYSVRKRIKKEREDEMIFIRMVSNQGSTSQKTSSTNLKILLKIS